MSPLSRLLSVRPGSVRNIIQQFENHTEIPGEEGAEGDLQRLSSSSLGEDSMDRYQRERESVSGLLCTIVCVSRLYMFTSVFLSFSFPLSLSLSQPYGVGASGS